MREGVVSCVWLAIDGWIEGATQSATFVKRPGDGEEEMNAFL